jgi:hypothetical protein
MLLITAGEIAFHEKTQRRPSEYSGTEELSTGEPPELDQEKKLVSDRLQELKTARP